MRPRSFTLTVMLTLALASAARSQDIAQQVRQTRDGNVRLVFASKPGVCGDGESFISVGHDDEGRTTTFSRTKRGYNTTTGYNNHRYRTCDEGPVRVELTVAAGVVTDVDTRVGGRTALPYTVSARAAADYLLDLAERSTSSTVAKHAILPALLADSVDPAPRLLQIGRSMSATREARKSAIFWVSQTGSPQALAGLKSFVRDADSEIGKQAVFGLSQLRNQEGATVLIAAARDHTLATEVRKSAIFWLGQAAGEKATEGLKSLMNDEDTEVKKQVVFALSQMKTESSMNALMDIARNSKDREVRKSALFWLGQSNDPRVLALFEDILLKQ